MTKYEVLTSEIKNLPWHFYIPDGIDDYDFEMKIQADVGVGNKFDLEITDTNSNIRWNGTDIDGSPVQGRYLKTLTNLPNRASVYIEGKATKIVGQQTCFFKLKIHCTYGNYTDTYDFIGTSYGDGLRALKVRTPNTSTNLSGIIKVGSSIKVTPNITLGNKRIGCVGDSITWIYQREFDYYHERKSENIGLSGGNVVEIWDYVRNYNFNSIEDTELMINLSGTNDSPFPDSEIDYETWETNYRGLCKTLKSFGTLVNIKILYVDDTRSNGFITPGRNANIDKFNAIIERVSQENGYPLIDMNVHMAPNGYLIPNLTYDGLHPNEAGVTYFNRKLREELDKLGV